MIPSHFSLSELEDEDTVIVEEDEELDELDDVEVVLDRLDDRDRARLLFAALPLFPCFFAFNAWDSSLSLLSKKSGLP